MKQNFIQFFKSETKRFIQQNGILSSIFGFPLHFFTTTINYSHNKQWTSVPKDSFNLYSHQVPWKLDGWPKSLGIRNTFEMIGEFPLPFKVSSAFIQMEDDCIVLRPFSESKLFNTRLEMEPPVVLSKERDFHWRSGEMSAAQLYILEQQWAGPKCLKLTLEIPQIAYIFTIKLTQNS